MTQALRIMDCRDGAAPGKEDRPTLLAMPPESAEVKRWYLMESDAGLMRLQVYGCDVPSPGPGSVRLAEGEGRGCAWLVPVGSTSCR